jgi:peptidoglycan hydrolase CwlO-like protein
VAWFWILITGFRQWKYKKLIFNLKNLNIMSETNFPTPSAQATKGKNYKNAIIGVLAAGLIAVSGYLIYAKSDSSKTIQLKDTQIAKVTDEKSDVQANFDASLARLDSMSTVNTGLESQLTEKNNEIAKVKSEIRSILNKKNATAAELNRAKTLIASLNEKISSLESDVAKLKQDNQLLTNDNVVLKQEKEVLTKNLTATTEVKESLEKKVDVASTLNASNIMITPIDIKKSGKEKVSTTAKRVDKFVVSFDVDNRIIQSGSTDVYVLVLGPDGKAINAGTETFTTRTEGDLAFTAKVPIELETAKKKNVEFAFIPGTDFKQGNYIIQIYQNGFLIGQATKELKKGGLFS